MKWIQSGVEIFESQRSLAVVAVMKKRKIKQNRQKLKAKKNNYKTIFQNSKQSKIIGLITNIFFAGF